MSGRRPSGETIENVIARQSQISGKCILWTGCTDSHGYGKVWYNKKRMGVHRVVWELKNGTIPKGKLVLHSCDTPNCINVEHLSLGSSQDNVQDMINKARINNSNRILTEEEIREVKNSTEPSYRLAKKYGVAESTIRRMRNGTTWKNIT